MGVGFWITDVDVVCVFCGLCVCFVLFWVGLIDFPRILRAFGWLKIFGGDGVFGRRDGLGLLDDPKELLRRCEGGHVRAISDGASEKVACYDFYSAQGKAAMKRP